MKVTLPLKEMSVAEKIGMMEELWNDLSTRAADYSSPDWHGHLLAERKRLAESGEIGFTDWEAAKREIQDRIR
ncbi:addiction module protein [Methylomonas sp. BW4-1]|uniref:Addiction module protein n=1 Tax=Methylomonas defluvii TaxID=3045149 RepID=A0ABU4UAN6_9GAMM|nr:MULTISPECIES: addiction module protein [unclassified Methylomonas]MDX8126485.1 addiction module protein [Methylomonas sp. OY6]NOV28573.1 acyl-protein synthetase [Methylomonas sp. ZR1]